MCARLSTGPRKITDQQLQQHERSAAAAAAAATVAAAQKQRHIDSSLRPKPRDTPEGGRDDPRRG